MKQIILAVQTPRAGKWNHRWIVPAGLHVDDVTLTDALSKFDSLKSSSIHKDGIVFYRSVDQPSTGRSAREFIFLYYPDFYDNVTAQGKNRCHDLLKAYFESKMDQLVTSIDWDNTDGAMIYHSSDLTALYNDFEQAMLQNLEQTNIPEKKKSSKRSGWSGVLLSILTVAIIAGLFYFGFGAFSNWFGQRSNQNQENSSAFGNSIITPGKMDEKTYDEWKKLFTFPNETDPSKRYEMVQSAVKTAFKYYHGEERNPTDEEICISKMDNTNNFAKRLYDLRDNPQKVLYSNENSQDLTFEESIKGVKDPAEFQKAVNELPNVNEAVKEMLRDYGKHYELEDKNLETELDKYIINQQWTVSISDKIVYPNFFFDTDDKIIKSISDYIKFIEKNDTLRKVVNVSKDSRNAQIKKSHKKWGTFKDNFKKWFPERFLENE